MANFGIFAHDDVRQQFEDCDASSQIQPDGSHFQTDDAASDDNGLTGYAFVVQSLVRGLYQAAVNG